MKTNLLPFLPKTSLNLRLSNTSKKLLMYTAGALLTISTLSSCCPCKSNDRFEKTQNNQNTELLQKTVLPQETYTNTVNYETYNKISDKPILSDIQNKAIKAVLENFYRFKDIEIIEKNGKKIIIQQKNRKHSSTKYSVKNIQDGIELNSGVLLATPYPERIKVIVWDDDYFEIVATKSLNYHEKIVFRKDGSIMTQSDWNNKRQASIQKQLDDISFFDNTNKKMLAHVVSSMNIKKLDILEKNGYVEAYGENGKSSYEFIVKQGSDNSLYGVAIVMKPNNQSESKMFAFSCTDKSSPSTNRYLVTKKEVVQTEVGDPATSNNEYKNHGSTTRTDHKVNDVMVKRGLLAGVNILPIDEQTFTRTYLEGATHNIYTIDEGDNNLKINGEYAFNIRK